VTERKDLLSGLFFVLTLGAYDRYVRGPSRGRYAAVMILFVLGLLGKPMLVTLPLVLLLLDFWPLGRFAGSKSSAATAPDGHETESGGGRPADRFSVPPGLIREKIPLFLIAAAFCLLTAATEGKAAVSDALSFPWRFGNALVAYVAYVGQFFCPVNLAVFYPHPETSLPVWKAAAAAVVLAGITAAALASWRRYPYLAVGWLWYVVTMLPVIGLLQVGGHAMADRFTYVTQIGIYIALAWAAADVLRFRGWLGGILAALALAAFMGCAWRQVTFWSDTETLWNHAAACIEGNYIAYHGLGRALAERQKFDEAVVCYRKSLESKPRYAAAYDGLGIVAAARGQYAEAIAYYQQALAMDPWSAMVHNDLGAALAATGRPEEAVGHYRQALAADPQDAMVRCNLANVLAGLGRLDEAIEEYRAALAGLPDGIQAYNNLGIALAGRGRLDEAVVQFQRGLKINPDDVGLHCNLGNALSSLGQYADALTEYQAALKIQPDHLETQKNLAWLRATCPEAPLRNRDEAIELAQRASRSCQGARADVLDCLAAAYAAGGWFPEALSTAQQALELAKKQKDDALANDLRARIALYEAGKPFRQTPSSSAPPTR
jgi:tetratricopeptide (TPR) repeat protein